MKKIKLTLCFLTIVSLAFASHQSAPNVVTAASKPDIFKAVNRFIDSGSTRIRISKNADGIWMIQSEDSK